MRNKPLLHIIFWGCVYIFVGVVLFAAVGATVLKKPFLITPIRSNSMYPLLKRGDVSIIYPFSPSTGNLSAGDVIVFRAEEGSLASQGWVIHRIVDGDSEQGYTTMGDANPETDQESGGASVVTLDTVIAKAITLNGRPLRIRLMGYPSLWLESTSSSPLMVPAVLGTAGVVLLSSELFTRKKRERRASQSIIYLLLGLIVSVVLAATQLSGSTFLTYRYEISDQGQGALMGSSIGIVQPGETVTRTVSDVTGKGIIPMVISVTTSDPNIIFDNHLFLSMKGTSKRIALTMVAAEPGKYNSQVTMGLFLPTLPPQIIHMLARTNYWLALTIVSLIPSLPMIALSIADRRSQRALRRTVRKLGLPL